MSHQLVEGNFDPGVEKNPQIIFSHFCNTVTHGLFSLLFQIIYFHHVILLKNESLAKFSLQKKKKKNM